MRQARVSSGSGALWVVVLALPAALALVAGGVFARTEARAATTTAQTEATMEAYLAALFKGDAYESFLADDVKLTMTGLPGEIEGLAAVKAAIDAIHYEQFDARPEITSLVVGEGTAALEAVFVATHTGEFAGIAPAGAEVAVPYSVFYELADGKITAVRAYALAEGLVQQLQAGESGSDWAAPPEAGLPGHAY
jgi:predicted ester cyclase